MLVRVFSRNAEGDWTLESVRPLTQLMGFLRSEGYKGVKSMARQVRAGSAVVVDFPEMGGQLGVEREDVETSWEARKS